MAPFIYRRTGQRSLCTFYTWHNSTNGTCSGNAPPGRSWTGHNPVRSTSAHTHPCPLRSCCTVGPGCPGSQWSHCAGNNLGWGRRRPGPLASACWNGCSPAPACPCGWSSWQQHCHTSPSAGHRPCGSQPAAASRSWGCRSPTHHGTCRPRPPACIRPAGKEMQSGKAVFIPAALAAGLITMNSSSFHNCFDYPPISVVLPFRKGTSLLFLLLQLPRPCSLNRSISGHVASKHDFPTPLSFTLADFWLDSRVKSRKEERVFSVCTLETPPVAWTTLVLQVFPFRASKREHLETCPFPTVYTRNQCYHGRDTSASFWNKSMDPHPFPPLLQRGARSGTVSRGVTGFQRGASRCGSGGEKEEHLHPALLRSRRYRAASLGSGAELWALAANRRHLVSRHFPALTGLATPGGPAFQTANPSFRRRLFRYTFSYFFRRLQGL